MKKNVIFILIIIFTLCFTNTVFALNPQRCMYEGTNDDGSKFKVLVRTYGESYLTDDELDDYIWIQPLDKVRVKKLNKDYDSTDLWTSIEAFATVEVKDDNSKYNGEDLRGTIIEEDGCFNYLYWQAPIGLDNWYFSNNSNQSIGGTDKLVRLDLVDNYQDTSNNAILEELTCTYTQPNGAYSSMPDTIIYRLTRNDNGYSYEILGESGGLLKTWYEGEASVDQNGWNSALLGMNVNTQVLDLLNPRVFWYSQSKAYSCPSMIMVGYDYELTTPAWSSYHSFNTNVSIGFATDELDNYLDDDIVTQLSDLMSSVKDAEYKANYTLAQGASFIRYEAGINTQGNICNYGIPSEMNVNLDNWYYSVAELVPNGYSVISNDTIPNLVSPTIIDIPSGKLMNSCEDLPYLYTDCLDGNNSECKISTEEFSGSVLLAQNGLLNEIDKTTVELGMSKYNGYKYKFLMCQLGDRLNKYTTVSKLSLTNSLHFYDYQGLNKEEYSINNLISRQCDTWGIQTVFDCDDENCLQYLNYNIETKLKEIATYCDEIYSGFISNKLLDQTYKGRVNECIQFQSFYSSLVSNGIIRDLSNSCKILSNDFVDKLDLILDILKIAGPILAVGLGTLDFIKVVVSGDADKEMKSAFKKFSIRIVSAILLFIVPVILAFLMDTFLGNQNGYDSDNPFCDVVEFNE